LPSGLFRAVQEDSVTALRAEPSVSEWEIVFMFREQTEKQHAARKQIGGNAAERDLPLATTGTPGKTFG